jgi:hypothetical protein
MYWRSCDPRITRFPAINASLTSELTRLIETIPGCSESSLTIPEFICADMQGMFTHLWTVASPRERMSRSHASCASLTSDCSACKSSCCSASTSATVIRLPRAISFSIVTNAGSTSSVARKMSTTTTVAGSAVSSAVSSDAPSLSRGGRVGRVSLVSASAVRWAVVSVSYSYSTRPPP